MHRAAVLAAIVLPVLCAQELPEGKGKSAVQEVCTTCHGMAPIVNQRATKKGWISIVNYMVSRGATGTDDQIQQIIDYLSINYGKEPTKIHINRATLTELQGGLELTASEAEAIADYRSAHGSFKNWDSLSQVTGLDLKKLESKKDVLAFD